MIMSEGKDIMLKEFLGDLYDDLMTLTQNDKQRVLNILEHYADKSGFFERIKEHIEYLESEIKQVNKCIVITRNSTNLLFD